MTNENGTALRAGQRLRSQVCDAEIVVVRAGSGQAQLGCGGYPMVDVAAPADARLAAQQGYTTGAQLGKRYTARSDDGLDVLVTKTGEGTLTDGSTGDEPLLLKETAQLPASD